MDTLEKVIDAFKNAGKPLKAGEIAEITGVEKKDVEKTIKALKNEGKIFSPKRCFYDLKE